MSQSAGTSGFAPAWGVHQCPSLQASEGGSSYGSRGRPPDTTGRAVPLTGFPRGVLRGRLQATHYGSAQACSRTNIHKDHGPTMPAGTTPPSSPTYDSHRLHLPNSTDGSRTTLTQLRLSNDKAVDILTSAGVAESAGRCRMRPPQASRASNWA